MPLDRIIVRGAREHNLKNIDVEIPRDKLVVITGLSGSGKSPLASDTIYAEGQRRYVESLSAYARQFLGQMEKPDVDHIEGLSPAISIDQKGVSKNPRSTVGTITEIYDYLRLLYARTGHPHCPNCGRPIAQQTVQQIVDSVLALPDDTRYMIMAPLVRDRKGEHQSIFEDLRKAGFVRVRVDGRIFDLSEEFRLDKQKKHTIEVVVDRLVMRTPDGDGNGHSPNSHPEATRIADSVETALKLGSGVALVALADGEEQLYSEHFACVHCGISIGEIAPRSFSFNSPHGACPTCTGLGTKLEIDPDLVIPNKGLSISEGAILPWQRLSATSSWYYHLLTKLARRHGFSLDTPVKKLSQEQLDLVFHGERRGGRSQTDSGFEGVITNLERRFRETESEFVRGELERYMSTKPCPTCNGKRLKPESLAVTVDGRNIAEVTAKSVLQTLAWLDRLAGMSTPDASALTHSRGWSSEEEGISFGQFYVNQQESPLTGRELTIAHQILKEIRARLSFLIDVGLDYLTLNRPAASLSGGESQRIRLATQIGSGLMGVLYICDEPSVGLHAIDEMRLIRTLKRLRDLGNTILVVEHDEAMMRAADWIVDLGPGAGEHGGYVVAAGPIEEIIACPQSITGQYLSGAKYIPVPAIRRPGNGKTLMVKGARENNLKNIDVGIPLGMLVCVTGVSGSGKSTLVDDIIHRRLAQAFYQAREKPGVHEALLGWENLDKVVNVDQAPIGRTPRSNPATYTGTFTPIRELFSTVPEARVRGYLPGRFSFNVKGGRCEACHGEGYVQIEMHFLPDITVSCEVCKGQRYNREALEIYFKGENIAQVLDMTVEEALEFFQNFPSIRQKLQTLFDVGLGYIRLGQPATTLSGGEAQRVKLATELSRRGTGRTLYILDEPTTGLAFEDAKALLGVLQRLVEAGNTVLLIEHHLDLIKNADWIIDLGPVGGDDGGYIVAEGTPEQIAQVERSFTGRFLRQVLARN
ncbi:MAG: excinuclease ABC subunit UvrA [Dehalococcoidia bacterium]|nr:excinuclease ABC subunit UvrA [Dehalococcoidia bacterium]